MLETSTDKLLFILDKRRYVTFISRSLEMSQGIFDSKRTRGWTSRRTVYYDAGPSSNHGGRTHLRNAPLRVEYRVVFPELQPVLKPRKRRSPSVGPTRRPEVGPTQHFALRILTHLYGISSDTTLGKSNRRDHSHESSSLTQKRACAKPINYWRPHTSLAPPDFTRLLPST